MKILVINCGSSSLKYQLIDMENEKVIAKGNYERIGENESFLTHKVLGTNNCAQEQKYVIQKTALNHEEALQTILNELTDSNHGVIASLQEINAVGQPFDPSLHEAVSLVEDSSLGAKIVKEEFRKGYMIGDRVLRHSLVVVAN